MIPHFQDTSVVKTKDWFVTHLISMIPLVGLIFCIYWAFSSETNVTKANYMKAYLIYQAIVIGFTLIVILLTLIVVLATLPVSQWDNIME